MDDSECRWSNAAVDGPRRADERISKGLSRCKESVAGIKTPECARLCNAEGEPSSVRSVAGREKTEPDLASPYNEVVKPSQASECDGIESPDRKESRAGAGDPVRANDRNSVHDSMIAGSRAAEVGLNRVMPDGGTAASMQARCLKDGGGPRCKKSNTDALKPERARLWSGVEKPECKKSDAAVARPG